jgi:ABC-type transport system involved in multi-copper enzyme maturation permease subunit
MAAYCFDMVKSTQQDAHGTNGTGCYSSTVLLIFESVYVRISTVFYCIGLLYKSLASSSWTQTNNTHSPVSRSLLASFSLTHNIANCICCTIVLRDVPSSGSVAEAVMMVRFERWMTEHGRIYKDAAEKARRFHVFMANAIFVDSSNAAGGKKYHLAINRFANSHFDHMYVQHYIALLRKV